jgi:hypothetical protein
VLFSSRRRTQRNAAFEIHLAIPCLENMLQLVSDQRGICLLGQEDVATHGGCTRLPADKRTVDRRTAMDDRICAVSGL